MRTELEALLSETVSSAIIREASTYDDIAEGIGDKIVLFGAGGIGRRTLEGLRRAGISPLAFCDNNSAVWNGEIDGLKVLSPQDALNRFGQTAMFVTTIWRGERTGSTLENITAIRSLGINNIMPIGPLYWKFSEFLLPHYSLDLPHKVLEQKVSILAAYDLLENEGSRREFVDQVRWRLFLEPDCLSEPDPEEMYFPDSLVSLRDNEVFVDCGAFDGDTIKQFLDKTRQHFQSIIAFEPDPKSLDELSSYISTLPGGISRRIRVEPFAVAEVNKTVHFAAEGSLASAVTENEGISIDCVTMDSVLSRDVPTYVKIDVEGYELNALRGAANFIKKFSPVLAVCSYHTQSHLWEIPLEIHKINPHYKLFTIRYAVDAWETVTYAIPPARLK